MKECRSYKDKLILFHHELLEEKEQQSLQFHIKECQECRKALSKIKNVFEPPKEIEPPNNLALILRKAKQIEKEEAEKKENLLKFFVLGNLAAYIRRNAKLVVPAFIIAIAVGLSPIMMKFLAKPAKADMYMVNAFGKVDINGRAHEKNRNSAFAINREFRINVSEGECSLQFDKDKQILLNKNTDMKVTATDSINIELLNGEITGRVVKGINGKKLVISAGDSVFTVVGTVFSVKKDGEKVELSVKDGTVNYTTGNDKPIPVTREEKLVVADDKAVKEKLTRADNIQLEKITDIRFLDDITKAKKVFLNVYPYGSDIYSDGLYLGKSPGFVIVDKDAVFDFTVRQDGYESLKININELETSKKIRLAKLDTATEKNDTGIKTEEKTVTEKEDQEIKNAQENAEIEKPIINENGEIDISNIRWKGEADNRGSKISIRERTELEGRISTVAKYEFGAGKWVQIAKDMRVNAMGLRAITFEYIDTNPLNNKLKLRMSDYDGSLFGTTIRLENDEDETVEAAAKKIEWRSISFDLNELSYLGGGDIKLDLENLTRLVISLEKEDGGDGRIGIRNLIFKK